MIVIFDAQCLLCNSSVKFLLKHDRRGLIQFASAQGATGSALLRQHGLDPQDPQSFLLIDDGHCWQQSAAVLRVVNALGWPWRLGCVAWLVPVPLRDVPGDRTQSSSAVRAK